MTHAEFTRLSPDLTARLGAMSAVERKVRVGRVCQVAVEHVGAGTGLLAEALKVLAGKAEARPELVLQVEALTAQLDERAWDVQDQVESGKATEADYELAFRRARASAAVGLALAEPTDSAMDVLYEAYFAIGDEAAFMRVFADE